MNFTSCRSLVFALLAMQMISTRAQHAEGAQAIPSVESADFVQLATTYPDTAALRAMQDELDRLQREAIVLPQRDERHYGLYLRANEPLVIEGALARNQYAEMIPILEEGLRIARELAARDCGGPQTKGRP